jgi:hypothetical protein
MSENQKIDKYKIMDNNRTEKKPIQQMHDDIKHIKRDVIGIKMDLIYIKDYIRRKNEEREREQKQELAKDAEYVQPSKSWFW